jgi:hypothetical protein
MERLDSGLSRFAEPCENGTGFSNGSCHDLAHRSVSATESGGRLAVGDELIAVEHR